MVQVSLDTVLSPEAKLFRALALLPATNGLVRNKQLASISSLVSTNASPALDAALVCTDAASCAVYHAKSSAGGAPEPARFLDALARRCMRSTCARPLCSSLASAVYLDRTFQLELACSGGMRTAIGRFTSVTAANEFAARQVQLSSVVDLIDAVESEPPSTAAHCLDVNGPAPAATNERGGKPQYRMSEVDALFFEALDADSELLYRVWDKQETPPITGRLRAWARGTTEPYHELMQTRLATGGGLATKVANAVASCDWAADSVLARREGLAALRLLAETPPDEARDDARRLAFFQTELARAVANIAAGASDMDAAASEAVDTGLVALLGEWATEQSAAGGHLQAESWRALHNLREAVVLRTLAEEHADAGYEASSAVALALSRHISLTNGLLPLQPPGGLNNELARRRADVADEGAYHGVDVVFVHGIRGSPLLTWRDRSDKNGYPPRGKDGSDLNSYEIWPRDWLHHDAPFVRLISAGHDASVLRGGAQSESTLAQRASRLRRALRDAGVGKGRRVVFVTHSYGGLLVKEALADDKDLWGATRGVVFFATPHAGSPIAQSAPVFSRAVRELVEADSGLAQLHDGFIGRVRKRGDVSVVSFGEDLGYTAGRQPLGVLVPEESANPGVGEFAVVEGADHVGVCKLGRKGDWRYRRVLEVVFAAAMEEEEEVVRT